MAEDSNDSARRAFGDAPASQPVHPPAPPAPHAAPVPANARAGALAAWRTRAAAFILDGLFVFGLVFAIAIAAAAVAGTSDRATLETIVYAAAIPLGLLYAPLLMARRGKANGQTFGKQMLDIRVVRADGGRVTFWNGVVRQVLGQQIPMGLTVYLYGLVDYLWPLRDQRNQALHDKLAGTLVVRTKDALQLTGEATTPRPPLGEAPPSPRTVDEVPVHGWLPPRAGG